MKPALILAILTSMTAPAWAQQPNVAVPQESQARQADSGTVTSPNPENKAVSKIEAAGRATQPSSPRAPTHESAPGTAENNSGGR